MKEKKDLIPNYQLFDDKRVLFSVQAKYMTMATGKTYL